MKHQDKRLAAVSDAINSALDAARITPGQHKQLAELALAEAETALGNGTTIALPLEAIPLCFGKIAKLIRLGGELPLYFAKVTALWLASLENPADLKNVKVEAQRLFGLHFEREFLQLVFEAYAGLPDLELDEKSLAKAYVMKDAHRRGYYNERVYRGCAQCALAAVLDVAGKQNDDMFRAANGFAAGMGLLGDGVCGGYSGGLMAFGMFAGRRREFFDGDKEQKDLNGLLARKLHEKFIQTYGTVICHGIHNEIFGRAFHITKPEDKEAFELAGAHSEDKCPSVVGASAAWAAEILFDNGFLTEVEACE